MEKFQLVDIEKIKAATAARNHALKLLKKSEYGSGWRKIGVDSVIKVALAPSVNEAMSNAKQEFKYDYSGHFVNSQNGFCSVVGTVYPPNNNRSTHEFENFRIIPAKVG